MRLDEWWHTPRIRSLRLSREWRSEPSGILPRWTRSGVNHTAFEFLRLRLFERSCLEHLEWCLQQPDPSDMRRGHRVTQEGSPQRWREWLPVRMRAFRTQEVQALGLGDEQE